MRTFRPFSALFLPFLFVGCQRPSAPQSVTPIGIPPPSASPAQLAISAVQAYRPVGSKKSVQDWVGYGIAMSRLTGFKDVGWGSEPDGAAWKVTYVFLGVDGKQHSAEWRSDPKSGLVTPLNSAAKQISEHLKTL